ncbi:follistatin-related protein 5-like [Dendronephthya gigantea]|uniref:follistatin-related protein 5-like n=1 Tax=Dendronephthya gigantea TaxID=151771 RepID=UPI00106ABDAE|nr:follistatin-related protein 5-like [Dendronephthya gigantea]
MEQRVLLPLLVLYGILFGHSASAETGSFYVLGSDGIYVIDPVAKSVVAKITNTTAPGLCTKSRYSRRDCTFTSACAVDDTVFVADGTGSSVHVIDIKTHKKIETIPTDPYPYGLHCLLWRNEVWVHSWNLSTFDVIAIKSRVRTHKAVQAHVKPGFTHGIMVADEDMLKGNTAFVTHFSNPGIHELNLEGKSYTSFRNFTKYGCTGTYGIAYNPYNKHIYVDCQIYYKKISILELDTVNDRTKMWSFPGFPFVSPDGRYVVFLYRTKNTSQMNILAASKTGFNANHYPELRIPGGVSHAVFYSKGKTSEGYYVFLTLDYANKMAIVDLDLAKNGNISDVKYIEDVDFIDKRSHGTSRDSFIAGHWIISPATKEKTVVIINAETQKIHGKVSDVNGGGFAVWVPDPITAGGASAIGRPSCFISLFFLFVCLHL